GPFVNGASGELFGTGIPARKRAVSSGEDTTWPDASICCGGGSCRRLASAEAATKSTQVPNGAQLTLPVEKLFNREGQRGGGARSACAEVKEQASHSRDKTGNRFGRFEKQQINHHPNGDGSEDDWRHWIKPDVIGPRNIRSGYAQDDYSDDREERAEQEREL